MSSQQTKAMHRAMRTRGGLGKIRKLLVASGCAATVAVALCIVWVRSKQYKARHHRRFISSTKHFRRRVLRSPRFDPNATHAPSSSTPKHMHMGRVAVIGAGVSGLAAAYWVKKWCPDADVHVFEKDEVAGGNIQTVQAATRLEPIRIETGPRSLRTSTASAQVALQLIDELGIGNLLSWANKKTRGRRFVFEERTKTLEELPISLPQFLAFAYRYNLLAAIFRDLWQAVAHKDGGKGYETCEAFFAKHFSAHLARRFVSALVHGIFSGDSNKLLLKYAFPSLWEMEQAYGSVIIGFILDPFLKLSEMYQDSPLIADPMPQRVQKWLQRASRERVASLEGGLTTLITALWDNIIGRGVHVHTKTSVARISYALETRNASSSTSATEIQTSNTDQDIVPTSTASSLDEKTKADISHRDMANKDENSLALAGVGANSCDLVTLFDPKGVSLLTNVDCVISTLPPEDLQHLFEQSLPSLALAEPSHRRVASCANKLAQVRSLSIAVITFVFFDKSFHQVVDEKIQPGFGFLMPRILARGHLLGVVYDSCVFPDLAGPGHVVLTAMLGGDSTQNQTYVEEASQEELISTGLSGLQQHLGLRVSPSVSRLTLWRRAIPQFDHLYATARSDLETCIPSHLPWLFVGGKAFGYGVGVNDCILTSKRIAREVTEILS
eukprot:gene2516-8090_t